MKQYAALTAHRRRLVLERLQKQGVVKTSELSEAFSVSPMTIRNDLNALAQQDQLVRTHGGAIIREWLTTEPSYQDKANLNRAEKERIGKQAAGLIEEGMAVFIGNGTTTMEIIKHLPRGRRVRIFTNALNHALEVDQLPQAEVFIIGGHLRGVSLAMVGRLAHQALKGVYFDLAFLGVNGISMDYGLTIPSLEEAETAAEIIRHSQRTVIVADHTKFGIVAHGRIADICDIDAIITDNGLEPRFHEALVGLDVELYTI
ncbi:DeoR/GlpR transcriptional regulator [Candidatus Bipolaricaulota bacterium]|nr:DeoR/GlpR transcriptional regulator [Candidatus Bipolaricaulota bacterium]